MCVLLYFGCASAPLQPSAVGRLPFGILTSPGIFFLVLIRFIGSILQLFYINCVRNKVCAVCIWIDAAYRS